MWVCTYCFVTPPFNRQQLKSQPAFDCSWFNPATKQDDAFTSTLRISALLVQSVSPHLSYKCDTVVCVNVYMLQYWGGAARYWHSLADACLEAVNVIDLFLILSLFAVHTNLRTRFSSFLFLSLSNAVPTPSLSLSSSLCLTHTLTHIHTLSTRLLYILTGWSVF